MQHRPQQTLPYVGISIACGIGRIAGAFQIQRGMDQRIFGTDAGAYGEERGVACIAGAEGSVGGFVDIAGG
ncbi:hypothetical protein D3C84_691650 [compost metagenome]